MKTTKILTTALLLFCTVAQAEIQQQGMFISVTTIKDTQTVMGVIEGYLLQEYWRILIETSNNCMNGKQPGDTPERKKCEDIGKQKATAMLELHNAKGASLIGKENGRLSIKGHWTSHPNNAHDELLFNVD